jgi:hypothetical protein
MPGGIISMTDGRWTKAALSCVQGEKNLSAHMSSAELEEIESFAAGPGE